MNPPKMPIHIGDFLRDTGHLRAMLIGAYLLLLFHHWSTGSLPDDDEQLSAISRLTPAEWRKARPILVRFFDEGWHHGRVEEDLASAKQSYEARAKAGSEGGKAKAAAKQSSSNATASPKQPLTLDQIPKKETDANASDARASEVLVDDGWPADFREQFWARYPNKVGKPKALKKLESIRKRGALVDWKDLMAGLDRYIRDKPPDRQWLNPETFLNQERWTDQPAETPNGHSTYQNRTAGFAGSPPTGDDAIVTGMARALERRRAERAAADAGRQEFRGGDGGAGGPAADPGAAPGDGGASRQLALLPRGNG